MKKLALALCLVLALGAAASAAKVDLGDSKIEVSQTWNSWANGSGADTITPELWLNTKVSGENWSVEGKLGNLVGALAAEEWIFKADDGTLNVAVWGDNKTNGDLKTPFAFVESDEKAVAGQWKARVKYAPVTVVIESDTDADIFVFGEQAFGGATVGGAVKSKASKQDNVIDGYVKTTAAGVNLMGEVALNKTPTKSDKNSKLALQAQKKFADMGLTATAKYTAQAANWGDQNAIYLEGKQDSTGLMEILGSFENRTKASDSSSKGNTIAARIRIRGDAGNQAYDDQFATDKYFKNVAYGLWGRYEIKTTSDKDKSANTLDLRATTPVVPEKAWVLATLKYISDEDGSVSLKPTALDSTALTLGGGAADKSSTEFNAYGRYLLTSKIMLNGELATKAAGKDNYTKFGGSAEYKFTDAVSMTGSYFNDSSKLLVKANNQIKMIFKVAF